MAEPLRLGIMSTAHINQKLLAGAALTDSVTAVAVASRDPGRADEFADRWSIQRRHAGYDALLADDTVEAVYIARPNALHHPWTMRALTAGKHVLCEKLYSRRASDAFEAFDLADSRALILSEAFMYRYHPQMLLLQQHLLAGTIGELQLIVSCFTWPNDQPGTIRLDADLDGGSLMDVGVYPVNAARLLAGEPHQVTAQKRVGPTGVDVGFVATLKFPSGVLAHIDSGFGVPERSRLEIIGSKGTMTINDPWHGRTPGLTLQIPDQPARHLAVNGAKPYKLQLQAFAHAVRGAPTTVLGRADAIGQARVVEALHWAADQPPATV